MVRPELAWPFRTSVSVNSCGDSRISVFAGNYEKVSESIAITVSMNAVHSAWLGTDFSRQLQLCISRLRSIVGRVIWSYLAGRECLLRDNPTLKLHVDLELV